MNLPKTPWTLAADRFPSSPIILDANGKPVCAIAQRSGHPMDAHPESDAAARLILSAAELLNALQELLTEVNNEIGIYPEDETPLDTAAGKAKAVIAKAIGV